MIDPRVACTRLAPQVCAQAESLPELLGVRRGDRVTLTSGEAGEVVSFTCVDLRPAANVRTDAGARVVWMLADVLPP